MVVNYVMMKNHIVLLSVLAILGMGTAWSETVINGDLILSGTDSESFVNEVVIIKGDILVMDQATLTVTNSLISVEDAEPQHEMIVKNQGKLELYNSEFGPNAIVRFEDNAAVVLENGSFSTAWVGIFGNSQLSMRRESEIGWGDFHDTSTVTSTDSWIGAVAAYDRCTLDAQNTEFNYAGFGVSGKAYLRRMPSGSITHYDLRRDGSVTGICPDIDLENCLLNGAWWFRAYPGASVVAESSTFNSVENAGGHVEIKDSKVNHWIQTASGGTTLAVNTTAMEWKNLGGTLENRQYLTVTVHDRSGKRVEDAHIRVYDSSGSLESESTTDSEGNTPTLTVTNFVEDEEGLSTRTPHTIIASAGGLTDSQVATIDNPTQIYTTLDNPPLLSEVGFYQWDNDFLEIRLENPDRNADNYYVFIPKDYRDGSPNLELFIGDGFGSVELAVIGVGWAESGFQEAADTLDKMYSLAKIFVTTNLPNMLVKAYVYMEEEALTPIEIWNAIESVVTDANQAARAETMSNYFIEMLDVKEPGFNDEDYWLMVPGQVLKCRIPAVWISGVDHAIGLKIRQYGYVRTSGRDGPTERDYFHAHKGGGYTLVDIEHSIIDMRKEMEPGYLQLVFGAACPIDIEVSDPTGRTVSANNTEIPNSRYISVDLDWDNDPDSYITVDRPEEGRYQIRIHTKPGRSESETYDLRATCEQHTLVIANATRIRDTPTRGYSILYSETGLNIEEVENQSKVAAYALGVAIIVVVVALLAISKMKHAGSR